MSQSRPTWLRWTRSAVGDQKRWLESAVTFFGGARHASASTMSAGVPSSTLIVLVLMHIMMLMLMLITIRVTTLALVLTALRIATPQATAVLTHPAPSATGVLSPGADACRPPARPAAGTACAFVATVITQPADMIKTRAQLQRAADGPRTTSLAMQICSVRSIIEAPRLARSLRA